MECMTHLYMKERPSQRQRLTATALPRSAEGEQPCLETPMDNKSTCGRPNTAISGPNMSGAPSMDACRVGMKELRMRRRHS
jgi:hypothetical protein